MGSAALNNWYAAYIVTAVVLTVVVAVLALATHLCRRIGEHTLDIAESLDGLRESTDPLRAVPAVAAELNEAARSLERIRREGERR